MAEVLDEQKNAIVLLEKHEMALGHLYEVYAEKLPDHSDFWNDLSTQERSHGFMIRTFRELIESGELTYEDRNFDLDMINTSMEEVNSDVDYALRNDIDVFEALSTAMDLEKGMIEDGLFDIKPNDPEDLKNILEALCDDTKRHFRALEEYRAGIS